MYNNSEENKYWQAQSVEYLRSFHGIVKRKRHEWSRSVPGVSDATPSNTFRETNECETTSKRNFEAERFLSSGPRNHLSEGTQEGEEAHESDG